MSPADRDIVELADDFGAAVELEDDCVPAADAAVALARSRPVTSALNAFLFMLISLGDGRPSAT
jgi:hypothetical protein